MHSTASSPAPKGIAAIVGVGARLGRSIARKFAHEGYTVAILSRDLDEIAREKKAQVFAIRIDCSDSRSIKQAFEGVLSLGFVEVLVYNAYHPAPRRPTGSGNIRLDHFEKSVAVASVGAFHCAQQVITEMVAIGKGTILFTGCSASLNGVAGYADLCCGKFAMRGLAQCLARELQTLGVHVAHIIIHGQVETPRGKMASPSRKRLMSCSVGEQGVDGSMDPDACSCPNLLALARSGPIRLDPRDRLASPGLRYPYLLSGKTDVSKNALSSDVCLGGKTRTFDLIVGAVAANNRALAAIAHISKEMAMGSGHALDGKKLLETGTAEPVQGGAPMRKLLSGSPSGCRRRRKHGPVNLKYCISS